MDSTLPETAGPEVLPDIRAIAERVRLFLEPHWWCWNEAASLGPGRLSRGACDRSSLFLARVLTEAGYPARFVSGAPSAGAFGFRTEGVWRGHAWVECADHIIDITADQFGEEPVQIVPVGDARYSGGEDLADVQIGQRREEVVAELLTRWKGGDATTDCGDLFTAG